MRKPRPRKTTREALTDAGKAIAGKTLETGKDVAIGATLAQTAPVWAPAAASVLFGLGVLDLVLTLMCGGMSGLVTFVITDNFNTASFVGLIGFGVGFVLLPITLFLVYRRVRRHRLMKAMDPHMQHVKKHVKHQFLAFLLGVFGK